MASPRGRFDGSLDSDGAADDSLDFDGTEDGSDDGSLDSETPHYYYLTVLTLIYYSFRLII